DDIVGIDDVAASLRHLVGAGIDANGWILLQDEVIAFFLYSIFFQLYYLVTRGFSVGYDFRPNPEVSAPEAEILDFPQDHSLIHQALERLRAMHVAAVEEDLVPEARIKQVQDGMLGAADVEIDRQPVLLLGRV